MQSRGFQLLGLEGIAKASGIYRTWRGRDSATT